MHASLSSIIWWLTDSLLREKVYIYYYLFVSTVKFVLIVLFSLILFFLDASPNSNEASRHWKQKWYCRIYISFCWSQMALFGIFTANVNRWIMSLSLLVYIGFPEKDVHRPPSNSAYIHFFSNYLCNILDNTCNDTFSVYRMDCSTEKLIRNCNYISFQNENCLLEWCLRNIMKVMFVWCFNLLEP